MVLYIKHPHFFFPPKMNVTLILGLKLLPGAKLTVSAPLRKDIQCLPEKQRGNLSPRRQKRESCLGKKSHIDSPSNMCEDLRLFWWVPEEQGGHSWALGAESTHSAELDPKLVLGLGCGGVERGGGGERGGAGEAGDRAGGTGQGRTVYQLIN